MAILNLTDDSFYDGGRWRDTQAGIDHGFDLAASGADLIDIGAESTRPGYTPVAPAEQIARLGPVLQELAKTATPLCVDTTSAQVAHAAIKAGVSIVNDVSGGLADADMLALVADAGVDYICQAWPGWPHHNCEDAGFDWTRTRDELQYRRDACLDAGIKPGQLILDPGLGFNKGTDENWAILANIDSLVKLGQRVMVGASHKRFLSGDQDNTSAAAITAWCAQRGVWAVRVHEPEVHRRTIDTIEALFGQTDIGG